ncbi:hypothetical protein Q3G72_001361 [Acer saccharum]|nr:hypothetical protein Q3G72_001361 [Acer saccharum]
MLKKATQAVATTFSISDGRAYGGVRQILGTALGYNDRAGAPCVTVDSAMQLGVVWACVRLIAETISTLPLITYKRRGDGRVVADDHPLYALLHDSPNADMTAVEFWEAVVSQLCLWGNAFIYKTYDGTGELVSLDPLDPSLMAVRRLSTGALQYIYSDPRGIQKWTRTRCGTSRASARTA